ncbi:magnesium transporter [candidate division LCP-89 bacterium B3_LCP]|uniref:Magnesium transporter MgtE n=1 Tax=candidate division LCP-89 bacterium B3_LCP TaxID=2012998 RepID=A0A532V1V2_UNCL8|nr:MAG: magnesium transporter [candidate division LCP-89 bacterium B3_LCP]
MTESSLTEFHRRIQQLVHDGEVDKLREVLGSLHPSDIASLFLRLDRQGQNFVWDLLPEEITPEVLVELDEPAQEELLDALSEGEIGRLVDELDSDDAADVIGSLDDEKAQKVLDTLDVESQRDVRRLLTYEEDTAGGIMALEVASVKEDSTVRQAVQELRDLVENEGVEDIYNVYIVSADGILRGVLNLRQFILAPPKTPVSELIEDDMIAVPTSLDQEDVANIFRKYDLVSLPVIDDYSRLVGRITVDDIVDVLTEEAEEDLSIIAGTRDEDPGERSTFKVFRERFPWLLTGLAGGLIAATVMHHFQATLLEVIALAFFVPVITAMAGSTAIQSSSIVVRGLATGEIGLRDLLPRIFKEIRVALLNGLVLGIVLGGIVSFWLQEFNLGILLGFILLINICIASVLGASAPILMKRIKIDPALAMGPFVTTAIDILGLLIYLGFAMMVLT